jgi:hypothetical protein
MHNEGRIVRMSLQVLVTFPGQMNLGEFSDRLSLLKEMGCHVHVDTIINVTKKQVGAAFNRLMTGGKAQNKPTFQVAEALSPGEEKLIDLAMERIHREGSSDLLDMMTANAVGNLKPNMSKEIVAYYRANPGHTTAQGAGELAEKFVAHYYNVNDAFTRIRSLINTMSYANGPQKKLEKRGGTRGRGNPAQVYAI